MGAAIGDVVGCRLCASICTATPTWDAGASKIAWGITGFAGGDTAAGLLEEEEREPWFGLSTGIPPLRSNSLRSSRSAQERQRSCGAK